MENNALQIAMAVIGVLGGAGAWNFYSKRLELKHKETADDKTDQNLFRDQILQELERVKNELGEANKTIVTLTAEVSTLRERVKNLESENDRLLRS